MISLFLFIYRLSAVILTLATVVKVVSFIAHGSRVRRTTL